MFNTTSTVLSAQTDTYLNRNLPWIMPAFATLVLGTTPALIDMLGITLPLPNWLPVAGAVLGCFLTGLRAVFVDTVSARIILFLGTGLSIGIIVAAVLH